MKKYKTHIIWAIVAVVALVGGFYYGKSVAPARGAGAFAGRTGATGTFAGRGGVAGAGGGFVAGTVSAIDANSITLQLANGNSENVFYSSSTSVVIPQTAPVSSITTGAMVMIGGTQNSDGSMTATTIQVRNGNTPGGPGGFTRTNGTGGTGGGTAPAGGTVAPNGQY